MEGVEERGVRGRGRAGTKTCTIGTVMCRRWCISMTGAEAKPDPMEGTEEGGEGRGQERACTIQQLGHRWVLKP